MTQDPNCYGCATMRHSCEHDRLLICDGCGEGVESLNEASQCEDCYDKWFAEQVRYWKPLYEGEKRAGLLGSKNDE